ncbi:MAG: RDD family protein [Pseudomonadota bacterium]|jgi:uncharacterized RDD family membrane protein YckC
MSELWYYVDHKGETAGPVDFGGLADALRTNGTGLNTLVWIDGMAGWAKAAETPTIVERLRLRRSAVPPPSPRGPGAAPAARIDPSRSGTLSDLTTNTHPWRRFFARGLDASFATLPFAIVAIVVLVLGVAIFSALSPLLLALLPFPLLLLVAVFFLLIEAFCLSRFGTTPGKALYGISVRTKEGKRLSFKLAFWRAFAVFVRGQALWLPFVSLITGIVAYITLKRDGQTTWDRDGEIVVRHRPFTVLRIVLLVVIWSAIVVGSLLPGR